LTTQQLGVFSLYRSLKGFADGSQIKTTCLDVVNC